MANFKKMKSGRIQITVSDGYDIKGKQKRYYKVVDDMPKKDLEREAALFLAEITKKQTRVGSNMTVDELFTLYTTNHAQYANLSPTTLDRYKTIYKWQIKPFFANKKVNSVTKKDCKEWAVYLKDNYKNKRNGEPLKDKTIRSAISLFVSVLNYGIELEVIHLNPCIGVKIRRKTDGSKKKPENLYTKEEAQNLISLLLNELEIEGSSTIHILAVLTIIFTGIRAGEMNGLKWSSVNFDIKRIEINNSRSQTSFGEVKESTPKTGTSIRTISVPGFILNLLKKEKDFQYEVFGENHSGYVMITDKGTPQHPYNTYLWFMRFLKRHNLRHTTLHALRHTHVALLSDLKVSIEDISHRLGHSNPLITAGIYWYLFEDKDDNISNNLDNYFINEINK